MSTPQKQLFLHHNPNRSKYAVTPKKRLRLLASSLLGNSFTAQENNNGCQLARWDAAAVSRLFSGDSIMAQYQRDLGKGSLTVTVIDREDMVAPQESVLLITTLTIPGMAKAASLIPQAYKEHDLRLTDMDLSASLVHHPANGQELAKLTSVPTWSFGLGGDDSEYLTMTVGSRTFDEECKYLCLGTEGFAKYTSAMLEASRLLMEAVSGLEFVGNQRLVTGAEALEEMEPLIAISKQRNLSRSDGRPRPPTRAEVQRKQRVNKAEERIRRLREPINVACKLVRSKLEHVMGLVAQSTTDTFGSE